MFQSYILFKYNVKQIVYIVYRSLVNHLRPEISVLYEQT